MSDWLTYSPISGHGNGIITITANTLSSLEDRVATIVVSNSQYSLSASTSVTQKGVQLTAITFENLTWVTDVPASGGTATSANCSFSIIAKYSDNSTEDITNKATISGSLAVPATTATTRQSVGTLTLTATYEDKTCTGNIAVYQENFSFSKEPLTFNITSDGTIMWIIEDEQAQAMFEFKLNNFGWRKFYSTIAGSAINVKTGDKVQFRGDNATYTSGLYSSTFSGSTAGFSVEGNIMSLINSTNFENVINFQDDENFRRLFSNCTGLTSAENLILPVTTLSEGCYSGMFAGCTSLTTAPELPATTLADSCYRYMFYGCSNLTTAPELPATTLKTLCYTEMFYGCSKLNYIKCLATNISAYSCTLKWVSDVASTGTFVKNSNMPGMGWERGVNGIPEGWTVQNDSAGDTGNVQLNLSGGPITLGTDCSANFNSPSTAFTINGLGICGLNGDTNIDILGESTYMFSLVRQEDLSAITITYDWSHDSITYLNAAVLVLNFDNGTTSKTANISYNNGFSSTVVDLRDYFTPNATSNVNLTINASIV